MPNPQNVIGRGNRFSTTNQPANRGRKPRLYTLAKTSYNVGWDEFRDVMLMVMQMTKSELEALTKDEETPAWVVNIARAIYKDTGKGRIDALRELMDRAFGKVPQRNEVSLSAAPEDVSGIPTEALLKMHEIAQMARQGVDGCTDARADDEKPAEAKKTAKKTTSKTAAKKTKAKTRK